MKKIIKDKELTISLEGRITADNSDEYKTGIEQILDESVFEKLVLDFKDIEYISSTGLRILLTLSKKYENFRITNVNSSVYEILEVTGFTSMIPVEKALRKISLEGAVLIGDGFFSKVYRLSGDTIVKIFIRDTSIEDIKRELDHSKQAFIRGIPTAISYDIIEADNKKGVIFELLNCGSLKDAIIDHPEQFDLYIEKYAALLKLMNSTDIENANLPSAKEGAFMKIDLVKPYIESSEYEKLFKMVSEIPDQRTFIHGDCHIKNIMIQNDELLLIDMDTLSYGHPIFELSGIYSPYIGFDMITPNNVMTFFELKDSKDGVKIWEKLADKYFEGCGKEQKEANIQKIVLWNYVHMLYWILTYAPEKKDSFNRILQKFHEAISITDSLVF